VTITDNGGGISADVMPKIFDPYFTTKEKTQGTGIGLYMSKIIIEQNMGGSLTARNVADGVAFRIEV
jgi:C4-dicarboxylate-specific signal transduction histidine kinase